MKKSNLLKIALTVIIVTNFILNIVILNNLLKIKKDTNNIKWDVSSIDDNVNYLSGISDDIEEIKDSIDDIEYYLY